MRSFILSILLAFVFTLLPQLSTAQNFDKKWAVSTGVDFLDYQAPMGQKFFQTDNFDLGLQLGVARYLSGAFALSTNLTLAQGVRFPGFDWNEQRPNMVDMNYLLHFKFNNGALMKEQAFFAPYFVLGFGGSYVKEHPDLYVPMGGGIQFRLSSKVNLKTQVVIKRSINKDFQNLSHAVAFVYNIGSDQEKQLQAPDSLGDEILITIAPDDRDADGIIDKRDACPEVAGKVSLEGCPDKISLARTRLENLPNDEMDTPIFAAAVAADIPVNSEKAFSEEVQKPSTQKDLNKRFTKPEATPVNEAAARKPLASDASFLDRVETVAPDSEKSTPSEGAFNRQDIAVTKNNYSTEKNTENKPLNNSVLATRSIQFQLNSDELSPECKAILDEMAYMLHNNREASLIVKGHADATGTDRYNKVLSIMRAYHVKYYLVYEQGISQTRIVSTGFGEDSPIANNTTESGRSLNRRVDFELVQ